MKREYSTKNIDRILRQVNGLVANKRGNNRKSVISGTIGFASPKKGFIDAYIDDDTIFGGFDEWIKENLDEGDSLDNMDYEELSRKYDDAYYDDLAVAYRTILEEVEPVIDNFNETLEIYEIKILDGDYDGIQLHVVEKSSWYIDVPDSKLDKIMEHERRKVNKFLIRMAHEYGFKLASKYTWVGPSNINIPK